MIRFRSDSANLDWEALRQDLINDGFHNGRTTAQLKASFDNSQQVVFAFDDSRCVGKARALSDGIGNAYVLDTWTHSQYRRRGIARELVKKLSSTLPGQHLYLQTDEDTRQFWEAVGFRTQPHGLSLTVGQYLQG